MTINYILDRHVSITHKVVEYKEHIGPSHTGLAVDVKPGIFRHILHE